MKKKDVSMGAIAFVLYLIDIHHSFIHGDHKNCIILKYLKN